jgi:hypothetical protein
MPPRAAPSSSLLPLALAAAAVVVALAVCSCSATTDAPGRQTRPLSCFFTVIDAEASHVVIVRALHAGLGAGAREMVARDDPKCEEMVPCTFRRCIQYCVSIGLQPAAQGVLQLQAQHAGLLLLRHPLAS